MKVYIAGPMTGYPHHNTPAFDAAADRLRAAGYEPVSPPDITRRNPQPGIHSNGTIDAAAYVALVRLDLIELLDCAAVVLLPGWSKSKGCALEIKVAEAIGLPVYALDAFIEDGAIHAKPLKIVGAVQLYGPPVYADIEALLAESGDASRVIAGEAVL